MIELEVEIDDAIRTDANLLPIVEHASTLLAEAVRRTDAPVTSHWQLVASDQQIATVRLEVTQGLASAAIEFPSVKLLKMRELTLDLSMIRLWGDVLEKKSHAQTERLKHLIENL